MNSYCFSERNQDSRALVRQKELEEIRRMRNRRRRELQREVLPVVLWSKRKPMISSNPTPINTGSIDDEDTSSHGILQPCVQFLNIDSSHAVRLFTPQFESGPISTPITIFCVAIATEDGCFFSGLHKKFEMGHLYPQNSNDTLIERSPISLCTEYEGPFTRIFDTITTSDTNSQQFQGGGYNKHYGSSSSPFMGHRTGSGFFHSDDSSCDMSYFEAVVGDPGRKCICPFSGLGDLANSNDNGSSAEGSDDDDDDDKEDSGHVCRGQLGPGSWHLYCAVYDGENSRIRIDGVEEPVTCDTSIPPSFQACLDGLTIGADHTFDMSLCFGQGSDGEGEGAMTEFAVFKGKLDDIDIETLELQLMDKHGISRPDRPQSEIALDDEYNRLAHSLLVEPWIYEAKMNTEGPVLPHPVPLRYLARLRQVAWKQFNPVTGEAMTVQRIGSKAANDSSEW